MEEDKMQTVRVKNNLGKFVFIEVSEDIFEILKKKVIAEFTNTTNKMQLLQDLKISLDKLIYDGITEEMVNQAVNESVNNLKQRKI